MIDPLVRRLTSRSEEVFEAAAREALDRGEAGERALIEAMEAAAGPWRKFELAVCLGRADGDLSLQALRGLLTDQGPKIKDARNAALHFLAIRLGPGATTDLVGSLGTPSTENLHNALLALCVTGDGSGWTETAHWLRRYVRRDRRLILDPPEVGLAVAYLAFTADSVAATEQLIFLVGQIWGRLKPVEKQWITAWWPSANGDSAPVQVPDPEQLRALKAWASQEFLGPG